MLDTERFVAEKRVQRQAVSIPLAPQLWDIGSGRRLCSLILSITGANTTIDVVQNHMFPFTFAAAAAAGHLRLPDFVTLSPQRVLAQVTANAYSSRQNGIDCFGIDKYARRQTYSAV